MRAWSWHFILLVGAAGWLVACGGGAQPQPTCGAEVCVTGVRVLRVDPETVALFFYMTEADGRFVADDPPTFRDGLHVRITDQTGERRLLDRSYGPDAFSCVANDHIPGAEGTVTAACVLPLTAADFSAPPDTGGAIMLTVYGDTFPIVLWQITFP